MADIRLQDGEEIADWPELPTIPAPLPALPRIAQIVTRVTTWSDGTVHVERPGEPVQVVVPLEGGR